MSVTQYSNNIHEFIVAKEQFDMFSKVFHSTLDALENNPKTKKLGGFKRTYLNLGIESATLNSIYQDLEVSTESDSSRKLAAKLGIGAMTQKLIDLIKVIFNKLIGRGGNQLAETVNSILQTIKEINGVRYTKSMHHRLPSFNTKQDEINWNTVWTGYKDRVAELDNRVEDISTKDFYLNYVVPKDKQFYRILGDSLAGSIGIPPCYANGERVEALNEYLGILSKTRAVISTLKDFTIADDRKSIVYNAEPVNEFVTNLETVFNNRWKRVKYNANRVIPKADWPESYSQSDAVLLRNIDIYVKDLKNEVERLVNKSDINRQIETALSSLPPEQQEEAAVSLRRSASNWLRSISDILSNIASIHSQMSMTDQRVDQSLKSYRRILDLMHRG